MVILHPGEEEELPEYDLKVIATYARHPEIVDLRFAIGLIFVVNGEKIGFPSDTGWDRTIVEQFTECELLFVHLGTVEDQEIQVIPSAADEKVLDQQLHEKSKIADLLSNHLCLTGATRMIHRVKPTLAVISEFGEELRGQLRTHVVQCLDEVLKTPCLAGDIGLRVRVPRKENIFLVRCFKCR